jgi:hypothetical protein
MLKVVNGNYSQKNWREEYKLMRHRPALFRDYSATSGLVRLALLVALCGAAPLPAQQQNGTAQPHGRRSLAARAATSPPTLDGRLDDAAWLEAPVAGGFTQKEPAEGQPASEATEVRVVYTPTTLYIAVLCADSNPAGIRGSERRRDGDLSGDDTVSIVLDTFHDHRNAFLFRTNSLGTEYDALISDEGKTINDSWDERWEVAAAVSEKGWAVEFAIPFKSVRVAEPEGHGKLTFGLDVQREIRRKNEIAIWNDWHRGFLLEHISMSGHLTGLEGIETGLRLRVKPYVLGGFSQFRDRLRPAPAAPMFRTVTTNASNIGIEDLKLRLTPSLTADLTYNTDFAQSDVDALQITLDRFPLFFPEKREFFQEGSGIFDIGTASRGTTATLRLFHSRTIGLSPRDRRPVDIIGGGRITGKVGGFSVGLLNVQTEGFRSDRETIPASNYSVARIRHDVFSRSTIGAFVLNREKGGAADYNRVYGSDAILTFARHFTTDAFFAKSDEPGRSTWAWSANAKWDSDFFLLGMEYLSIDPGFRSDMAFIRRADYHRFSPQIAFRPRPNISWIRQMEISGSWDYQMNASNQVVRRIDKYAFQVFFQDGGLFRAIPFDYEFDRVERAFEVVPGVVVPAHPYQWNVYVLRYQSSPKRRYFVNLDMSHRYGYYKGNLVKFQTDHNFKINAQSSVEASYEAFVASIPGGDFTQHVLNLTANYALNNQWLTSTTLQWDNIDRFGGVHFRLNYIFRPGDDFFLIYDEGRQVGGPNRGEKNRSLQAKFTYSFDY